MLFSTDVGHPASTGPGSARRYVVRWRLLDRLRRCLAQGCWLGIIACATTAHADGVTSAVYVRADTDDTLVVSPRIHASTHLTDPTQFDATYAADVWTSASVDIRASASKQVTEQRNELDVGLAHQMGDVEVRGSYRYSVENDYVSHGATFGTAVDLANKSSTVALSAFGFQDVVGRAGDPMFSRALATLGGRATFTQLLDPRMFIQLNYEFGALRGYQASPYRFVGIGAAATGFGCVGATQCFREHVPDLRVRHAFAALLRRALSSTLSLGADYRVYIDSWQQLSHTLSAQLAWSPSHDSLLALRYRFYTQRGAYFYSQIYTSQPDLTAYVTRDRELSPMYNQRLGLDLETRSRLDAKHGSFVMHLAGGGVMYSYQAFVGLATVYALEITLALGLEN